MPKAVIYYLHLSYAAKVEFIFYMPFYIHINFKKLPIVFWCYIGLLFVIQMTKRLLKTLENTHFSGSPIIPVAAKPGGPEVNSQPYSIFLHS